ncbi:MAG: glutathione S-transferase family protein [Myxococcota bacterium]
MMKLFGSLTSPYVRRVRVVAAELSAPCTLVDAFSDEGQAELRRLTPIWKVPLVQLDGMTLWETDVILDELVRRFGPGELRHPTGTHDVEERCLRAAIDECLSTLVKRFYLARDGVDVEAVAYLRKDRERVMSILHWLDERTQGPWLSPEPSFGFSELYLYTALDWIALREVAPLSSFERLRAFMSAHEARTSLVATAPPR